MNKVTVQEVIAVLTLLDAVTYRYGNEIDSVKFAERIRIHGIAPPDGWVLAPIDPTAEMISAAEEAYMPFGDMGMALICGNLAAAPKQESE